MKITEERFKVKQGITELSNNSKMFLDNVQNNDKQLSEATTKYSAVK